MAVLMNDVTLSEKLPSKLLLDKHSDFICSYGRKKDDYEYCMTEYLRMSGMFWGLSALDLMGQMGKLDKREILEFIKNCQHSCGGFGASLGHDPHILYTLSAVQILAMYDAIDTIDVSKTVEYVKGLQQPDGSFMGDKWGEIDTRFSFCSVACLALLKRLDAIDLEKAVEFVLSCMNFDGGFGCRPGSETHAGQVYCCLGTLSIANKLHHVKEDLLGWWLCERQLPSGGLNGRPEKLPDVCYSWWVLASLKILGRIHWVDREKLVKFILAAQDEETGGFSDRPGDMVDPFHTLFGLAGLSLLGESKIKEVNPVFCMTQNVIQRHSIHVQMLRINPLTGASGSSIPSEDEKKLLISALKLNGLHLAAPKLSGAARRKLKKAKEAQGNTGSKVLPKYSAQSNTGNKILPEYSAQSNTENKVPLEYSGTPDAPSTSSDATKRPRQKAPMPPSTEKKPPKRTRDLSEPGSYKETLTTFKMAIIKENFPDGELKYEDVGLIQAEILRRIDESPAGETLPLLRSFSLSRGAMIYACTNLQTCQWLVRALDKCSIGEGTVLKVIEAKNLPRPVKMAFKTRDIMTEDANKLLTRVKVFNPGLKVENWRVLEKIADKNGQRLVLLIDRGSYNIIKMANFMAYTGVDQGIFKTLMDPEAKVRKL